jgi:hypothetical protein
MMARGGGRGFARLGAMMTGAGGLDRLKTMGGGPAPSALPPGLGGAGPSLPGLPGANLPPAFNPFKKP